MALMVIGILTYAAGATMGSRLVSCLGLSLVIIGWFTF